MQEIKTLERMLGSLKRKTRPYDCDVVDRHLRHHALRRTVQPGVLVAAEVQSLISEYVVSFVHIVTRDGLPELTFQLVPGPRVSNYKAQRKAIST